MEFVTNIARSDQLSCPFQVDACIAYNNAKMMEDLSEMYGVEESDDEDDEDEQKSFEFKDCMYCPYLSYLFDHGPNMVSRVRSKWLLRSLLRASVSENIVVNAIQNRTDLDLFFFLSSGHMYTYTLRFWKR